MLIAKTYGVRRIVSEENIWPFCVGCMVVPFLLLIGTIIFEGYYLRKKKAEKDKKKLAVKKNK